MATATYHHGVRVLETTEGLRAIRIVSTAVIGLIATADDADATFFPLDTPVLTTKVTEAIGKAGASGTLRTALEAIAEQARPAIVVVRVAEGDGIDAAAKEADQNTQAIGTIGADGTHTGIQALLVAQSVAGVKPRIIGAPGLDTSPVAQALATVAGKLRAMAYVSTRGAAADTVAGASAYADTFGQREVMVIHGDFQKFDTTASAVTAVPATAYALGLRARIDQEQGWHKTLSNVPVNGVVGITKPVHWDLQNPDSESTILNEAKVTVLINHQGFRFWGSRTCSTDPNFAFESAARTAHVLADTMAEGHFWAVDKPMHPSLVKDIIEGINAKMRELKAGGYILDGKCWYDESINETATLKDGKLTLDYDYTPVPPLEDLSFRQRITDRYYADFALRVATGI